MGERTITLSVMDACYFQPRCSLTYWCFHFCMEGIQIVCQLYFTIDIKFFSCNSSANFLSWYAVLSEMPPQLEINLLLVTNTETFNVLVTLHTYYFSSCLVSV